MVIVIVIIITIIAIITIIIFVMKVFDKNTNKQPWRLAGTVLSVLEESRRMKIQQNRKRRRSSPLGSLDDASPSIHQETRNDRNN